MRVVNRIFVTLISVLAIVVAVLFMWTPMRLLTGVTGWLDNLASRITGSGTSWTVAVIVAVLVILAALAVLVLELTPRRQSRVRIKAQGRGNARLRVESVAQTLAFRIDELEGVRKVVPHLSSHGKDLDVLLQVDASPSANVPALSDQIIDRTIRILEGELGLQIRGRVNLDISSEPYPAMKGVQPAITGPAWTGPSSVVTAPTPAVSAPAAPVAAPTAPVASVFTSAPVAGTARGAVPASEHHTADWPAPVAATQESVEEPATRDAENLSAPDSSASEGAPSGEHLARELNTGTH